MSLYPFAWADVKAGWRAYTITPRRRGTWVRGVTCGALDYKIGWCAATIVGRKVTAP